MIEIIQKLKEDFPGHDFSVEEKPNFNVIFIDDNETEITYSSVKNMTEDQDGKVDEGAQEALYEILKIEVDKFFNK